MASALQPFAHVPVATTPLARTRALETKSVGLIELWRDSRRRRFERDVLEGLSARPKYIPARYLLDDRGVQLQRAILESPENYVARAERDVMLRQARRIARPFSQDQCDVVDLSPGDVLKTRILLEQFRGRDVRYVPIASSDPLLQEVVLAGTRAMPWLPMFPVRAEAFAAIAHLAALDPSRRRLVLWLDSQIGQLDRTAALVYLRAVRDALRPGDRLLVSFDLVKEPKFLERAYTDGAGLQTDLHLNVLARINRELEAQFNLSDFRYTAAFCPERQAISCQLISRRAQSVRIGHFRHELDALEPIETELACKYRQSEVPELARRAGFESVTTYADQRSQVQLALWSA